jgi:2'-5' RNA ligase
MTTETIGIVANLRGQPYREVRRLWALFERKYGCKAIQAYSHPHVSFQAAKTRDIRRLKADFSEVVSQIGPFELEVNGVRHFRKDVIYLPVRRTRELVKIHKQVHRFLETHCQDLFELYAPEHWIPHVTLAMEDLTEDDFEKAWMELKASKVRFKQRLHQICMVKFHPDGKIRIANRYQL